MDTIPNNYHKQKNIFLRLDTDFYLSTKHELKHLYDLVNRGGVIISDDYNTWEGAKRACDEFFKKHEYRPLYVILLIQIMLRLNFKTFAFNVNLFLH